MNCKRRLNAKPPELAQANVYPNPGDADRDNESDDSAYYPSPGGPRLFNISANICFYFVS
jgi:hypothetical protein